MSFQLYKRIVVLAVLVLSACGGMTSTPENSAGPIGASGTSGASGSAGSAGSSGAPSTSGAAGSSVDAHGCAGDEYFPDTTCGNGSPPEYASCQKRPTVCDGNDIAWMCGCDGQRYKGYCGAAAAGVALSEAGGCDPQGMYACGYTFCLFDSEMCIKINEDGEGYGYTCEPVPDNCPSGDFAACLGKYDQCSCGAQHAGEVFCDATVL